MTENEKRLLGLLRDLLAEAETQAAMIDYEFGTCRSPEKLWTDNSMPDALVAARDELARYDA